TDRDRRTVFNTGSVGNCMSDPTPVYVILEGVMDSDQEAPFGIQWVRVPYDAEAELLYAADVGMPELDEYTYELRTGFYRGNLRNDEQPTYHRKG
ncbi:MAG TPA: metallophosphoesterase, partial [Nocardioides sp.]